MEDGGKLHNERTSHTRQNFEEKEYIRKNKKGIIPCDFNFEIYETFLKENYDCKDITENKTEANKIHMRIFIENQEQCFPDASEVQPVFYEILKNAKSESLYNAIDSNEVVYVYMDKKTGYYETNSRFLSYKLTLLRGVTPEEYACDSPQLLHLITIKNMRPFDPEKL